MYETIEQLIEAALANNADAQWDLAVCYAQGNGIERSNAKAFDWICRAAKNGHEGAANYVLDAYENGKEELGIRPDKEKLVEWADKLSENGSGPMSALTYARLTLEGIKNTDLFLALERVEKFADKGIIALALCAYYLCDAIGMFNINAGICDLSYFERAFKYMNMLSGTEGEPTIERKAQSWWHYALCLYKDNKFDECRPWFEMAIPYDANTELMYSIFLFEQADAQGESSPLFIEAYNHAKNGIKRNDHEIDKGLERSTYRNLSQVTCYGFGGTPVDLDASYRWCIRAAELGDETSKQRLPHYHKKLFGGYTFK